MGTPSEDRETLGAQVRVEAEGQEEEVSDWSDSRSDPLNDFKKWVEIYENDTPDKVRERLRNTEMLYPTSLSLRVKKFLENE